MIFFFKKKIGKRNLENKTNKNSEENKSQKCLDPWPAVEFLPFFSEFFYLMQGYFYHSGRGRRTLQPL
jgi:hypothetical protein